MRLVDFSAWPATDFAALGDGAYLLSGLTWTVSSTAAANAGLATGGFFRRNNADVGDDGAFGLRIFHDQNLSTTLSRGVQSGPRVALSLGSLIPSFDATRQYRFELEITRFQDNGLAFTTQSDAVIALYGPAGTPGGMAARFAGGCMQRFAANNANPAVLAGNGTRTPITGYTYQGGTNVLAIQIGPAQQLAAYGGAYTTDWPASTTLSGLGACSESLDNNAAPIVLDSTTTLEIGVESRQNNTGSIDVMFHRLRVLQVP